MLFRKLLVVLLLISSIVFSQEDSIQTETDSIKNLVEKKVNKEFPIVYKNDTIFYLSDSFSNYPPEIRANTISEKLQLIDRNFNPLVDSLYSEKKTTYYETKLNDEVLFITTQNDANGVGIPLKELADYRLNNLVEAFNETSNLSVVDKLKNIGFFILSFIGLIILFKLIKLLFNRIDLRLSKVEKKFFKKKRLYLKIFYPSRNR